MPDADGRASEGIGLLRLIDGRGNLLTKLEGLLKPPHMNRRTIRVVRHSLRGQAARELATRRCRARQGPEVR
jgi:hypothetical protein